MTQPCFHIESRKKIGILQLFCLLNVMINDPTTPWFPGEQDTRWMYIQLLHIWVFIGILHIYSCQNTHLIPMDRKVCPIWHPLCAMSPIPTHQTLPEPLCITLTALDWKLETVHVFFKLGADGDCTGHGPEGQSVRLAPGERLAVSDKGIVGCRLCLVESGNGRVVKCTIE